MRTYLIINNGVVVDIVSKEGQIVEAEDISVEFDTVTDDYSGLFTIGENYTTELWVSRNAGNSPYETESDENSSLQQLYMRALKTQREYLMQDTFILMNRLIYDANTKAIALQGWLSSIWTLYRSEVQAMLDDPSYISDERFTQIGDAPFTHDEIQAEYDLIYG